MLVEKKWYGIQMTEEGREDRMGENEAKVEKKRSKEERRGKQDKIKTKVSSSPKVEVTYYICPRNKLLKDSRRPTHLIEDTSLVTMKTVQCEPSPGPQGKTLVSVSTYLITTVILLRRGPVKGIWMLFLMSESLIQWALWKKMTFKWAVWQDDLEKSYICRHRNRSYVMESRNMWYSEACESESIAGLHRVPTDTNSILPHDTVVKIPS